MCRVEDGQDGPDSIHVTPVLGQFAQDKGCDGEDGCEGEC